MKSLAILALRLATIAIALAVVHYTYTAYFVVEVHAAGGGVEVTTDGWGRPLMETPSLLRGLMPEFATWAGWGWTAVDFAVIVIGGFGIGGGLWYLSNRLSAD